MFPSLLGVPCNCSSVTLQQLQMPPTYHTTPRLPYYFSNTIPHLPSLSLPLSLPLPPPIPLTRSHTRTYGTAPSPPYPYPYPYPYTPDQVSHDDLWYGTITPESIAFGAEERLPEEVARVPSPTPILVR